MRCPTVQEFLVRVEERAVGSFNHFIYSWFSWTATGNQLVEIKTTGNKHSHSHLPTFHNPLLLDHCATQTD